MLPTWLVAVVLGRDVVILLGACGLVAADGPLQARAQRHQQGHHAGAVAAGRRWCWRSLAGYRVSPDWLPPLVLATAGITLVSGAGLRFALRCARVARTGKRE